MLPRAAKRSARISRLLTTLAALLSLSALFLLTASTQAPSASASGGAKPTVVLVHGAGADASSWSQVIKRLQKDGYRVLAPAIPLRSLEGDAAYLQSILAQEEGPFVLVGHSYGGAVITNAAADADNVVGLVYVAAFAPDEGESLAQISKATLRTACCSQPWSSSGIRRDRARRRPWSLRSSPKTSTMRTITLEETTLWRATVCP